MKANFAFVELIRAFGEKRNATPAQVALAWLLAQKPFIVPIPGIDRLDYLDENIASTEIALSAVDLAEIDRAASTIALTGARLDAGLLSLSES